MVFDKCQRPLFFQKKHLCIYNICDIILLINGDATEAIVGIIFGNRFCYNRNTI